MFWLQKGIKPSNILSSGLKSIYFLQINLNYFLLPIFKSYLAVTLCYSVSNDDDNQEDDEDHNDNDCEYKYNNNNKYYYDGKTTMTATTMK